MLLPFFFLIVLWGHEQRRRAAIKFFIYTQAGGLLMLISIVGLYFVHGRQTGVYSFDYLDLLGSSLTGWTGRLLMLGFFAAFAVKLPAVPFHGWLPDAHSQANTAGSVLLAGLLIKVGAYGFLRFLMPAVPERRFRHPLRRHGSRGRRDPLRRGDGLLPDRPQADGRLHERQSHGLRAAGSVRLEPTRPTGRDPADRVPRLQHRRALHPGRGPGGAAGEQGPRRHGRALGATLHAGRLRDGPRHGGAGPARTG